MISFLLKLIDVELFSIQSLKKMTLKLIKRSKKLIKDRKSGLKDQKSQFILKKSILIEKVNLFDLLAIHFDQIQTF